MCRNRSVHLNMIQLNLSYEVKCFELCDKSKVPKNKMQMKINK